ncbi:MAG TPA: hypothetical protein VFH78_02455, partial [Candidatus Thermoplasmatota archaeon]|nr:hypothetical protein [Candidatus Thermoplasmatota archaeon]
MRLPQRLCISLATLLTLALLSQVLAAPVTVTPTGDASGSLAAASGTGDASAASDCSYVPVPVTLPGCVAGAAASGTGDATACASSYYGLVPCAGAAASVVGDARGCESSHASTGLAPNCVAAAASGMGDASACDSTPEAYTDMPGCLALAASGTGDADACADAEDSHWPFLWTSCVGVAASATGDASACGNDEMLTLEDSRCIGVALSGCDVHANLCTQPTRVDASAPTEVVVGADADGDGFPATVTLAFSRVSVDAATGETVVERDPSQDVVLVIDRNDADPRTPLESRFEATVPTGVALGPDADGDGLPARATVHFSRVVVERSPPNVSVERAPQADRSVTLDSNDGNENIPAPVRVSAPFASGVLLGPDADGDGVPSYVVVEMSELTLDRRNASHTVTRTPHADRRVTLDANDADPNVPARSIVRAPFASGFAMGPDADGDGVPAYATVEMSEATFDRRDASISIARAPGADQRVALDRDDADPNVPLASIVSATVFTGATVGPDADDDGIPAYVRLEASRATLDRRDGSHRLERDPAADRTIVLDANDGAPAQTLVDVEAEEDAEASVLAVSAAGDARATCASHACLAASGLGDAEACKHTLACVAASGAGDAEGYVAASGLGDATSCGLDFLCTAVSGAGDARAHDVAASGAGSAESEYLAASATGDATGRVPVSALGACNGTACVSLHGHAHWLGASATGDASGLVALALFGSGHGGLVGASATGDAEGGLVAVSGTG